jgi:hypothetical protein
MLGLRYLKSKGQPKIVVLNPTDPIGAVIPEAERPRVHVLHGRGGVAFLVLVNASGSAVQCALHVAVTHRSRLVSPYDAINKHGAGDAAAVSNASGNSNANGVKEHLVTLRCPQLSFMLVAAVIENSFLIESGMNLSVIITPLSNYCVTTDDKLSHIDVENALFGPVQLLD